jgi:hypothetical protein
LGWQLSTIEELSTLGNKIAASSHLLLNFLVEQHLTSSVFPYSRRPDKTPEALRMFTAMGCLSRS